MLTVGVNTEAEHVQERKTDMEHIEYAYTRGMNESEVEERLRDTGTGVLALARDNESYAIPLAHYYDGTALYFRLGYTEGSKKHEFVETTDTASYILYEAEPTDDPRELDSWSIMVTGDLIELSEDERTEFDTAEINRRFAPIRIFDESIDEIEITIIKLEPESVTGRITLEGPD